MGNSVDPGQTAPSAKTFNRIITVYSIVTLQCLLKRLISLQVSNATYDRKHADLALENYVTVVVMCVITTFFNSPFSDQSTTIQVSFSVV